MRRRVVWSKRWGGVAVATATILGSPMAEGYTRPLAMSTERVLSTVHDTRKEPSMPLFSFEGKSPRVHPTAFIAPTACLIGDVTVEENASVWYNAVVRADFSPIVIRRGANVQDCAVIHVTPMGGTDIGAGATVAHLCLIHQASLGEECLIGNGSTVRSEEPTSELQSQSNPVCRLLLEKKKSSVVGRKEKIQTEATSASRARSSQS